MTKPRLQDLDGISRENHLVKRMLDEDVAFTREQYIALFYGDAQPDVWTERHESLLPPVFRHEEDNARAHEAIEKLGEAIGVVYTGRIPR
ncbi:MAG: hypothetical protein O2868_21330 [Proteobacteria bacterium]|jgi:hypothetical protein|nr:hypothetical protein [Pseudomonadota bacterium]